MYEIIYYSKKVKEQVDNLPQGIRAAFMRIRGMMVNYGPNLSHPYTKPLGKGLFEIRAKGKEGIGRVFYCTLVDKKIILLHVLIKKTQKTPNKDLKIARTRLKEVQL